MDKWNAEMRHDYPDPAILRKEKRQVGVVSEFCVRTPWAPTLLLASARGCLSTAFKFRTFTTPVRTLVDSSSEWKVVSSSAIQSFRRAGQFHSQEKTDPRVFGSHSIPKPTARTRHWNLPEPSASGNMRMKLNLKPWLTVATVGLLAGTAQGIILECKDAADMYSNWLVPSTSMRGLCKVPAYSEYLANLNKSSGALGGDNNGTAVEMATQKGEKAAPSYNWGFHLGDYWEVPVSALPRLFISLTEPVLLRRKRLAIRA